MGLRPIPLHLVRGLRLQAARLEANSLCLYFTDMAGRACEPGPWHSRPRTKYLQKGFSPAYGMPEKRRSRAAPNHGAAPHTPSLGMVDGGKQPKPSALFSQCKCGIRAGLCAQDSAAPPQLLLIFRQEQPRAPLFPKILPYPRLFPCIFARSSVK